MAGAAALALVLVWYAATSGVPWLFLLAAWLFAFIGVAVAYAAWNRAGLRLHIEVREARPAAGSPAGDLPDHLLRAGPQSAPIFEGDAVEVEVGLDTTGAARGPAWLRGRFGPDEVAFGTGPVPKQGWRHVKVLHELARGPIGATSWRVTSSDPLGFFQGRRAWPDAEVALVLPRFISLTTAHQVLELEASVAAPRAGSGNEIFGVREFRAGDPLRRIHWRSSARRGELVVREFEPPGVQTLGIYCDPAPATREVADQVARLAASEAWDCLRDGGRVVLWAPGQEATRPSEARSLWALLEWLARYPAGGADALGAPPPVTDAVAVTEGSSREVIDALDDTKRRGGRIRAWVVGKRELDLDAPVTRVDTRWPL